MKFSRRVNYLLLSFLFGLNIAIRYPTVQHEIGVDSFVIHILTNSIIEYQYGKWLLHPLSYIGLYPLSYPSAYPFLAAGVSSSSGIDVELSILIISVVLGLVGVFSTYFLAREIKNDDLFCFIAAVAFSLSPIFIKTTYWQASTRNLFMALAPACILLLLKTRGFSINRVNILFIITLLTVGTSHRLGVFMIFILIAYLTAVLLYALHKQLVPLFAKSKRTKHSVRIGMVSLISAIFIGLLVMLVSGNNPLQGAEGLGIYEETAIITGSESHILILNLFISLIGRIGFMLIFGFLGFAYLIWKRNKTLYDVFLLVSLVFIFPTIGMRTYSSYFFLIFFSLLAGLFFLYCAKLLKRRKQVILVLLVIGLVGSVSFYGYMFDHWKVSSGSMAELTYDTGLYVRYNTHNTFITNDGLLAARVGATSGKSCLPIGGGTLHSNGPEQLIYDFLHEEDFQIIPIPPSQIAVGSDALYKAKGTGNAEQEWVSIHSMKCNEIPSNKIIQYNLQYSVSYKKWPTQIYAYNKLYKSNFLISIHLERYKIYDNGEIEIHYFEYVPP